MEIVLGCLLLLAIFFVLLPAVLAYRGWVLSILWGWFMVPLGLPPISVWLAIGISITVGMLFESGTVKEYKTDREKWVAFSTALLTPIMALGLGWLVHSFM